MNMTRAAGALASLGLALAASTTAAGAQPVRWTVAEDLRYQEHAAAPLTELVQILIGRSGEAYLRGRGENRVHIFDASGRYVRTVGRDGAGPGEFRSMGELGWAADTLVIADRALRRFVLFESKGDVIRAEPPMRVARDPAGRWVSPVALLRDGSMLVVQRFTSDYARASRMEEYSLFRYSRDGQELGTVATLAWTNAWLTIGLPGGARFESPQPWSDADLLGVAPDGTGFVVVQQPSDGSGSAAAYRLIRRDASGEVLWQQSRQYQPIAVTRQHVSQRADQIVEPIASRFPSAQAARRAVTEALAIPRHLPPARSVQIGMDGTVWVQREEVAQSQLWDLWDARGAHLGLVSVPPALEVLAVSRTHVWGSVLDEMDVPQVRRYRVVPMGGATN